MAQQIVSITSQGQITIPAEYRRKLKLETTKKALVALDKKQIIVRPVPDLLGLKGFLRTKKRIKPLETRQQFLNYLAKRKKE